MERDYVGWTVKSSEKFLENALCYFGFSNIWNRSPFSPCALHSAYYVVQMDMIPENLEHTILRMERDYVGWTAKSSGKFFENALCFFGFSNIWNRSPFSPCALHSAYYVVHMDMIPENLEHTILRIKRDYVGWTAKSSGKFFENALCFFGFSNIWNRSPF